MKFLTLSAAKAVLMLCILTISFSLASCGDDNSTDIDEPGLIAPSIIGTWQLTGNDPEVGRFNISLTFTEQGKCTLRETVDTHPELDYTYVFDYTLEGDLYEGATLNLLQEDKPETDTLLTGEFTATVRSNRLTLYQTENGTTTVFTRKQ